MKILNFGSLNLDFVYDLDHLARPGETVSSFSRGIYAGGKGLNQSIALSRAGARVYHAGAVGAEDGQVLIEILKANDVMTEHIRVIPGEPTGHAVISVDRIGQNCIILYGGTNQKISMAQVDEVLAHFGEGDLMLLQNEINQMPYIMHQASQKGIRIALNPSPMNDQILALDLSQVSYLILNEIEASDITGESEEARILDALLTRYPSMNVVLTLGERGAIYRDKTQEIRQDAFAVEPVDTTGAGDTFTGYFFAALSSQKPVREALLLACRASAISVTRKGAEASIPLKAEVEDMLFYPEQPMR